jgi:hypothetical protein
MMRAQFTQPPGVGSSALGSQGLMVAHREIEIVAAYSVGPGPGGCGAERPLLRGGTRGADSSRWAAGVENMLRERHARIGPGADVDPAAL